ncbi:hypothetical protein [Desulfurobacterium sp.]
MRKTTRMEVLKIANINIEKRLETLEREIIEEITEMIEREIASVGVEKLKEKLSEMERLDDLLLARKFAKHN